MLIAGRVIAIRRMIAARLPYAVNIIASYPCPFFKSSWPGRTDNSVSVSGHPRSIEGIKSKKVWVIAIEDIKTTRKMEGIGDKKETDKEIKKAPIRFIWIPGIRPVIVPAIIPRNKNKKISISII